MTTQQQQLKPTISIQSLYDLVRDQRIEKRRLEKLGQKVKYECPIEACRKHFTQYSSLQKHLRIHTGEKPYKCTYAGCNKAFTQISNLKRHQKLHTGEKPFACKICMKSYVTLSNLKQHEQVHIGKDQREKYLCPVSECPKSFFHKCSLNKHVQRLHVGFEFDIKTFPLKKVKITNSQKNLRKQKAKKLQKAKIAKKQQEKKAVDSQFNAKYLYDILMQNDLENLTTENVSTNDNSDGDLYVNGKRKFSYVFEDEDFFQQERTVQKMHKLDDEKLSWKAIILAPVTETKKEFQHSTPIEDLFNFGFQDQPFNLDTGYQSPQTSYSETNTSDSDDYHNSGVFDAFEDKCLAVNKLYANLNEIDPQSYFNLDQQETDPLLDSFLF